VPWIGRRLVGLIRWGARHPQPFLLPAVLGFSGWALWTYAIRSEAFLVAHVQLPQDATLRLRDPLIGRNIWSLDLKALAQELRAQQPGLKDVRVVRQLPDTIRLEAIKRVPIAQLRLDLPAAPMPPGRGPHGAAQAGRWYPVDRDGFIVPDGSPQPHERLVQLVGIDRPGASLRAGNAGQDERLRLALRALDVIRRSPAMISRRVTAVNVGDPQQIRFVLEDGTEVRCGAEAELESNLHRLRSALRAMVRQPFEAGYIDVRFQEPVVGPRT